MQYITIYCYHIPVRRKGRRPYIVFWQCLNLRAFEESRKSRKMWIVDSNPSVQWICNFSLHKGITVRYNFIICNFYKFLAFMKLRQLV